MQAATDVQFLLIYYTSATNIVHAIANVTPSKLKLRTDNCCLDAPKSLLTVSGGRLVPVFETTILKSARSQVLYTEHGRNNLIMPRPPTTVSPGVTVPLTTCWVFF